MVLFPQAEVNLGYNNSQARNVVHENGGEYFNRVLLEKLR